MENKLVYIVGDKGNMANRYKAVLDYIGVRYTGHDKDEPYFFPQDATHFIICTPTVRHCDDIDKCLEFNKPILCEKPISKDLNQLLEFEKKWGQKTRLVSMVNQYRYMVPPTMVGETRYDYFKSGADGLFWDCINIIGLASDSFVVSNRSPVWTCTINGKELRLNYVDKSYIVMLRSWLSGRFNNWDYAVAAHKKVHAILEKQCPTS